MSEYFGIKPWEMGRVKPWHIDMMVLYLEEKQRRG